MTLHLNSTGGLGNQLFQIAALIQAADRIKADKHIRFKSSGKTLRTFESRVLLESLGISLCSPRCKYQFQKIKYLQEVDDLQAFETISDGSFMSGYFQDINYNRNSRTRIIDAISSNFGSCCNLSHAKNENTAAVHVRIGDYAFDKRNFNFHGVLSEDYFENAILEVIKSSPIDTIYVYSDTPDRAREKIEGIVSRVDPHIRMKAGVCNRNNLICEMLQLSLFDSLILSNSSFSWWAAALGIRNVTVGPTRWYRDSAMRGVNPMIQDWRKIDSVFEGEDKF
jgi:hypothetical protein